MSAKPAKVSAPTARPKEVWPPRSYRSVIDTRNATVLDMRRSRKNLHGAKVYYKTRPWQFVQDWCDTWDTRNASSPGKLVQMPFLLFKRQRELIEFLYACLKNEQNGLVEKSRDMGATWAACAFSVWLLLYMPGASIGWGSRKAQLVDRIGDMDSIFEKMRAMIKALPRELKPPQIDMHYMKIINIENGASITGESGDDIGRGGRKLIYFKDESAHYEHPESIEAALADNTRVQIDISSVNGLGNVFHRRREAGQDWMPGRPMLLGKTQVFVLDSRDHPQKDEAWHARRRAAAEADGLLHVYMQEVERNYSAAVSGIVIPAEWVRAAIDADKKLGITMDDGGACAALDVADNDGVGDRNACAIREGVSLIELDEWGERDTGLTARRAVAMCRDYSPIQLNYDCIGVGSGVKAETNRLTDENLMPRGISLAPWDAGSNPLDPDEHVEIKSDKSNDANSPLNKDFYANLKAQAWWQLRRRFERTYRAVTEGVKFPVDQLINLPSTLPRLRQLEKELSQPTMGQSGRMKLLINKTPKGTRSPNLADAVVMAYWPARLADAGYDTTLSWVG